jgi:hypothetical protein
MAKDNSNIQQQFLQLIVFKLADLIQKTSLDFICKLFKHDCKKIVISVLSNHFIPLKEAFDT